MAEFDFRKILRHEYMDYIEEMLNYPVFYYVALGLL